MSHFHAMVEVEVTVLPDVPARAVLPDRVIVTIIVRAVATAADAAVAIVEVEVEVEVAKVMEVEVMEEVVEVVTDYGTIRY